MEVIIQHAPPLLAFMGIGPPEMIIVGIIAVLLFGSRLPSVARSMGRSLTEFKKGMQGVEDELSQAVHSPPQIDHAEVDDRDEPTDPRFEPPKSEPQSETAQREKA